MDIFRHFKRPKAALPSDWQERITPDFVSTLQDNEIFVFSDAVIPADILTAHRHSR